MEIQKKSDRVFLPLFFHQDTQQQYKGVKKGADHPKQLLELLESGQI